MIPRVSLLKLVALAQVPARLAHRVQALVLGVQALVLVALVLGVQALGTLAPGPVQVENRSKKLEKNRAKNCAKNTAITTRLWLATSASRHLNRQTNSHPLNTRSKKVGR
jgi:hypothetical protein